jgi:hypothetical protein
LLTATGVFLFGGPVAEATTLKECCNVAIGRRRVSTDRPYAASCCLLRLWKSPSDSAFAGLRLVVRSSLFAPTVIADNAIAAQLVGCTPAWHSSAPPAAGTNKVRKGVSTIATGNALTGAVRPAPQLTRQPPPQKA